MNSMQWHKIEINYILWKTLETLRHRHYDEWHTLTKKEMVDLVMKESRGYLNPQMVVDTLEDL